MKPCDKTCADPGEHRGPFKLLKTFEDLNPEGRRIAAEQCEACGNTVIRVLPRQDDENLPG